MADKRRPFRPWVLQPSPLGMTGKPCHNDPLPSKCFAKHKNKMMKFPTSLDSRRWVFVKEGLDDFRKGCPPCEGLITRGSKEAFLPMISHQVSHLAPAKNRRKLSQDKGLFSTLSAAQRERQAFVKDVETQLTQHPLALFPKLEEDIPGDILLKALEVLDSNRKMEHTWAYCESHSKETKEPDEVCEHLPQTKDVLVLPKIPRSHQEKSIHEDKSSNKDLPDSSQSMNVPKGIREFCEWAATLGDTGIDEEFMMQQIEVGFKCAPRYEDYHKKRVNLLPSNIKSSSKLSKVKEIKFSIQETDFERKLQKPLNPYKPNWTKTRYGAWYLKPKLWRKLVNNEPLIDPKVLHEEQSRKTQPDIIDDLYGVIAFKDFIVSKGYNMPDILEKLFIRKGWDYDVVKTPVTKAVKTQALIDDDEKEND